MAIRPDAGRGASGRGRSLKVKLRKGKGRTNSSRAWLERQLNDPYVAEAARLGYRSRSAFKLAEIDDRFGLLEKGHRVVDLGAAPGGWSQVAAARTGSSDTDVRVVAIDMHGMEPIAGVHILKMDFYDETAPQALIGALGGHQADVVLSDMAAHATGHRQTDHLKIMDLCETALAFAREILNPGGVFLCKVLRGGAESALLADIKRDFATVRHVKPTSSRTDSAELFLLAQGFRPGN